MLSLGRLSALSAAPLRSLTALLLPPSRISCSAPRRALVIVAMGGKKKGGGKRKAAAAEADAAADAGPAAAPTFTTPVTVLTTEPERYEEQLAAKLAALRALFAGTPLPDIDIHRSAPEHYRCAAAAFAGCRRAAPAAAIAPAAPLILIAAPCSGRAPRCSRLRRRRLCFAHPLPRCALPRPPTLCPLSRSCRSEFTVWHEGDDFWYVMFQRAPGATRTERVRVDTFPVATKNLNALMVAVRAYALKVPALKERLFQANFHTTLSGEAMVTLVYHKVLDDGWTAAARGLRAHLASEVFGGAYTPHVIGRSRKQKIELDAGHVTETLDVNGRPYTYRQVEGSFSQPNGGVAAQMLAWAQRVTRDGGGGAAAATAAGAGSDAAAAAAGPGDLLELYCGNGNFTMPLAANFKQARALRCLAFKPPPASRSLPPRQHPRRCVGRALTRLALLLLSFRPTLRFSPLRRQVVATELSKPSVEAARHNAAANGVSNVYIARMPAEEYAEAWRTRATKRRLEGGPSWEALNFHTVLVDPPRAGCDAFTVGLLRQFQAVVYISCNPETLHANLLDLADTHTVRRFAVFDQFPYTNHLECGVYLTRRPDAPPVVLGSSAAAAADAPAPAEAAAPAAPEAAPAAAAPDGGV